MHWHSYESYFSYIILALTVIIITAGAYRFRIRRIKIHGKNSTRLMEARLALLDIRTQRLEQANQHLHRLSYLDSLTGVANRRHFEEVLDLEWRRACRVGTTLSLIMIDVDFFKSFNDTYGHQRGDDCLILLASAFSNSLHRPGDLVARYGGEEFMIILPGTPEQGAIELAESIRARVEAMEIMHEGSTAEKVVTVSLGVVTDYPTIGFSSTWIIAAADEALYRAKDQGRNRVVVSSGDLKMSATAAS